MAIYFLDVMEIVNLFMDIQTSTILILISINLFSLFLLLVRWLYLVNKFKGPLFSISKTYMSSYIYNLITPANLGGDFYRYLTFDLDKTEINFLKLIIRERFLGFSSIIFLLSIAFLLTVDSIPLIKGWNFIFIFIFCASGIFFSYILAKHHYFVLKGLYNLPYFKTRFFISDLNNDGNMLLLFLISALSFIIWTLSVYFVTNLFNLNISFAESLLISCISELIRFIPVSIQGIGIRESTFSLLFGLLNYSPEMGFFIGAIVYLSLNLSQLVFGIIGKILSIKSYK